MTPGERDVDELLAAQERPTTRPEALPARSVCWEMKEAPEAEYARWAEGDWDYAD